MKKAYLVSIWIIGAIGSFLVSGAHEPHKSANGNKKEDSTNVSVCLAFERIYDINFKKQDYKIDFWCAITYPQNRNFDFRNQLQVLNAKKNQISVVDSGITGGKMRVLLKMTCEIFHNWDVKGFPFDGQQLDIKMYNAALDASKLKFITDGHGLHQPDCIELENGWEVHNYDTSVKIYDVIAPISDSTYFSSVTFNIDIDRANKWGLFSKLFVGMYVAFLAAFLALFINITSHSEPHFALTVGALFAAIANKYIVESLLPESPYFNLADKLHALTFSAITAIILISVIALFRVDKSKNGRKGLLAWIIRKAWLIIILPYSVLSAIFILGAFYHH